MSEPENREEWEGVAIIGMAGRFPGADSIDTLWQNLCEGVESITFFDDDELAPNIDPLLINQPNYIKARGILKDVEYFDADFFNSYPRESQIMDPQHRIFLEVAWQALENAGYDPGAPDRTIGVFGGKGYNSYFANNVSAHPELVDAFGEFETRLLNEKDFFATQVSYRLNLTGPSINVNNGCSTSLVAACLSFDSLISYQCDIALAGGITIFSPQNSGYLYEEGKITSADGHCRPFDARAAGTVFGNGVGIVVLKRLSEALEDGDCIYAVIKGCGLNNDGSLKMSFTAPSVDGQAEAIAMAQANAGVDPETITYIEAHGTATPLGDPVEVEALTQAFHAQTKKKQFCSIGSIKGNIGHLDSAAGVVGLIKTALALHHKKLPPSINFARPNPKINFDDSPFYVNTKLSEWNVDGFPRRAGVSSFGVGGTNAHVVIEEAPIVEASGESRSWQLLLLSAKTSTALNTMTTNLADHLKQHPDLNLADVACTLQVGRKAFNHRRMIVCQSLDDAVLTLEKLDPKHITTSFQDPINRDVVFMFSGQASQYVNMGLELYKTESQFQKQIDRCAEIFRPRLSLDLRDILYPDGKNIEEVAQKLEQTSITQPALFVIEYALAQLWISWGVQPAAMVGHSIGEYVAACLAGVFSLEDALSLVATRGRLMQELPGGSMLAVPLSENEIQPFLDKKLFLSAINSPSFCVVSGDKEAIEDLERQLSKRNVDCRHLHTSHAFHSQVMDPILETFAEHVKQVRLNPPQIPFLSNVTGTWITSDEAMNPGYWARHLRQTVRFSDCVGELLKEPNRALLEVGPGHTLSTLARQHPNKSREHIVLSSIRHPKEQRSDIAFILNTLGRLWLAGIQVDWAGFYNNERRHRLPLPTYPFERKRYWVEAERKAPAAAVTTSTVAACPAEEMPKVPPSETEVYSEQRTDHKYAAISRNSIEQTMANIWQDLLGIDQVHVHDNFFDLGGHSLVAIRLFTQIEKVFGKRLPLATLFNSPTINQLAELLEKKDYSPSWASLVKIRPQGSRPPFFCMHSEGGNVLEYQKLAQHLEQNQPFYGLQAEGLKGDKIEATTVETMATHYIKEMKTIEQTGPYYIGGYCLGGLVAFEMARQLEAEGENVAFLAMINASTPDHLKNYVPNTTILHRYIYRFIERIELEFNNLSVLGPSAKISYIQERGRTVWLLLRLKFEWLISLLFSRFHLKSFHHSRAYNLEKNRALQNIAYHELQPHPIQSCITFFRTSKQSRAFSLDPTLGWANLAKGGIQVYEVHGFHKNILKEPNVRALAEKLGVLLRDAQADQKGDIYE